MDYSYYENLRNSPRVSKAVFIKYDIRDEFNKSLATGVATSRDISLSGVKFVCSNPVKVGYIVKMEVQLDKLNTIACLGTVVWVENPKHGQYVMGVKFQPLHEKYTAKIMKFLNSFRP